LLNYVEVESNIQARVVSAQAKLDEILGTTQAASTESGGRHFVWLGRSVP
jgi:hypothetical protein